MTEHKTQYGKIPDDVGFRRVHGNVSSLVQVGAKLIRTPLSNTFNVQWNDLINDAINNENVDEMNHLTRISKIVTNYVEQHHEQLYPSLSRWELEESLLTNLLKI